MPTARQRPGALDGQRDRRTLHDPLPGHGELGRRNGRLRERTGTTRRCPPLPVSVMSRPVASSTIFSTTNLVLPSTGGQSLSILPDAAGQAAEGADRHRERPRGHPPREQMSSRIHHPCRSDGSDPAPQNIAADTLRASRPNQSISPTTTLRPGRVPSAHSCGSTVTVERRRIGRHFRIGAAASQPFERHIDRIDVVAAE